MLIKNGYSDNNLTQKTFIPQVSAVLLQLLVQSNEKFPFSILMAQVQFFLCSVFAVTFFINFHLVAFNFLLPCKHMAPKELAGNKKKQEFVEQYIYATCETHSMAKVLMLSSSR